EANGGLVLFQGRDQSYPDELNRLIQPLACQLCRSQMTSMKSAKDHYESKAHDRHISAWLAKNYTEAGLQTPPVKRLVKEGPTGPNAFHCTLCDLALTSKTHARQHYAGRKHQLVEQRRSKPSGSGYYNAEGMWVRTGTKAGETLLGDGMESPRPIEVMTSNGRQPGARNEPVAAPSAAPSGAPAAAAAAVLADSLTCSICRISVTSASQIKMHLDGAKHQRNLRKQSLEENGGNGSALLQLPEHTLALLPGVELDGELAMHRTPSGSYYCKLCNKAMNHISILQQHLQGKKHLKTVRIQQSDKEL
ncbi:hypothetical protein KR222_009177, partial [Zaprionus bogoriensis]